jgi:putative inorganic carbon (HCO3(-)) transporter
VSDRSRRVAQIPRQLPWLSLLTAAALACAQVEGYLLEVHPALAKAPAGLFLVLWFAHRFWFRRPFLTPHPVVAGVAALAAVVLISAALNLDNEYALVMTTRWLPFLVLTVVLIDVLAHDVPPRLALSALLAGALIAAAGALFSFVVLDDPRATGPLEDPNDLAYVLTAAAPIALVRLGAARGRQAVGLAAMLALLLAGSAATVSRGGALAFLLTLAWVTWRRLVPARLLAAGVVLLVVGGTAVVLIAYGQVQTALNQKRYIASTNVETRSLRWQAALRMLGDNPAFGVGPGGARTEYVTYSGYAELAEPTPVTHQMYLEVGAELGLIGLGLFLAVLLGAFVAGELAIRRLRRAHAPPSDPMLLAAYACQGSLLALCTSSMFLSEEYYMPLWAAIAVATALELRTRGPAGRPAGGP